MYLMINYFNIYFSDAGETAFQRTLIYGKQLVDQIVCGIKVNPQNVRFAINLGTWQVVTRNIENYLRPEKEVTLLEIGCKNSLVGLALSSVKIKINKIKN